VWGSHLGVSDAARRRRARLRRHGGPGLNVVRWFVFCDGRAGIVYDDRDLPAGLDPHFFADLDAALEIAVARGIALDSRAARPPVDVQRRARHAGRSRDRRRARGAAAARARARARHRGGPPRAVRARARAARARYGASGDRSDLRRGGVRLRVHERARLRHRRVGSRRQPARGVAAAVRGDGRSGDASERRRARAQAARCPRWAARACATCGRGKIRARTRRAAGAHLSEHEASGARRGSLSACRRRRSACRARCSSASSPATRRGSRRRAPRRRARRSSEYLEFALERGYAGAWPWSFSGTDGYGRMPHEPLLQFARRHPAS
jgi:hypothetical protein